MIKRIPYQPAAIAMLVLLSLVMVFHALVIAGIIPFGIVWGGRLHSKGEMLRFEAVSVLTNGVLMLVIGIVRGDRLAFVSRKLLRAILWLFVVLFSLNTVGNLLAKATVETIVFTPLTFVSAILCARLALPPNSVRNRQSNPNMMEH